MENKIQIKAKSLESLKNEYILTPDKKARHEIAKRTCYGKIKHKSWLAAEYIFNQMRGKDSHLLEIYSCPFCKKYHIGHNKQKEEKYENI